MRRIGFQIRFGDRQPPKVWLRTLLRDACAAGKCNVGPRLRLSRVGMDHAKLRTLSKACACATLLMTCLTPRQAGGQEHSEKQPVPVFDTIPQEPEIRIQSACSAFLSDADKDAISICEETASAAAAGSWDKAKQLADALEQRYPTSGIGSWWLGNAELKLGNQLAAVRDFSRAAELRPEVSLAHWSAGLSYALIEQYGLFEKEMNWLIEKTANKGMPYYYLGRLYSKELNQPERGIEYFQQALKCDPSDYRSRYYLGYDYELLGVLPAATHEYESAASSVTAQKVAYSLPLQGLARVHLQEGNLTAALRYAREATSAGPTVAENHLILGKVLNTMAAFSEAIVELKLAAKLDPSDAAPHYLLSRAYMNSRRPRQAEGELALFQELKEVYGSE